MEGNWYETKAWIAHYDILGFKKIIDNSNKSLTIEILKEKIDEIIQRLARDAAVFESSVEYFFYADTFIIYSKSVKVNDYPGFLSVTKNFIRKCISISLPIRGAVSFGELLFGYDRKIIMGKAFLESYEYGEDQNWLGLILTPSATEELKKNNLEPLHHGFINKDIPMRKYSEYDERIYAYYFGNGSTNSQSSLLSPLNEMMHYSPEPVKIKYVNTIKFIEKYYTVHQSGIR